ncbi:Crp/Fnr family transcriptional regulator [Fodinisporobacter ferrooxydans]|uniref:Crp/Fnr family transcriptional regulator n=1 Tax=Fodinisporobacter ferrooxydans TaxID=2901836 RepID=A0ABY4CF92_9BACL|nr:Crp/Fnr family transcriptional regulator [Alicyclobacillaceae bacterium MYW30-H2]
MLMMQNNCNVCYLKEYELFQDLSERELDQLGKVSQPTLIPKREYVFTPDQPNDVIYMLKKGRVRITRLSDTGKHITLVILEAGDIFGEDAILGSKHRKYFAEVLDDAHICVIDRNAVEQVIANNAQVGFRLAKIVEQRLEDVQEQLENIVFYDVQTRLARLLLKLADLHGKQTPAGVLINIKLTHEDMASLIGSTRETTSKVLNEFRTQGLVDLQNRRVILRDPTALAHMDERLRSNGA